MRLLPAHGSVTVGVRSQLVPNWLEAVTVSVHSEYVASRMSDGHSVTVSRGEYSREQAG